MTSQTWSDLINRRTWKRRGALRAYGRAEGYSDPGEEVALKQVHDLIRNGRTLDLGVGGGRTAGILLKLSENYVGLDYTGELVAVCRSKYPGVEFVEADARDLSAFGSGSFDFVQFSFNGICSIDGAGRLDVFKEAFRVLRRGGAFLFSTFMLENAQEPRQLTTRRVSFENFHIVDTSLMFAKYVVGTLLGLMRRFKYRNIEKFDSESATHLHGAHDYGFLVYKTSYAKLNEDLKSAGFSLPPVLIGCSGKILAQPDNEAYYHILVRK